MKSRLDMHDKVASIYHNAKPKAKYRMNKRLASILDPYIREYKLIDRRNGVKQLPLRLNIIAIIDLIWDIDKH
jgi:hypothetical protein